MSALAPIEKSVGAARRRLFLQALINRLALGWVIALALGLGWMVAEPWIQAEVQFAFPTHLTWYAIGGLLAIATAIATYLAIRSTPAKPAVAQEFDTRFGLRERVTTAFGLTPEDLDTSAGQAVVADASAKVEKIRVNEKFPIRPQWHAALIPVLAASVAAVFFFYNPDTARTLAAEEEANAAKAAENKLAKQDPKKAAAFTKQNKPPELQERNDKSEKLKDLENELNEMIRKMDNDPNRESPEKLKEKVAELTNAEDKLKKFQQEQIEKLAKMEKQLEQLDRLNKDPDFKDGGAKDLNDALSKGDLKKAQSEIDELKKKIKNKELTKEEQEKLSKQLDKMKDQMEKLDRNKEREEQLKKLIDKAKQEGKDAESLERELDKLKQESKEGAEAAKQLAQQFKKAKEALDNDNLEQAAQELEKAGASLQDLESQLQDLEEAQDYLQRLKDEKKAACKACEGKGDKDAGRKDDANGQGRASGNRPENKDAASSSEDQRIKGLFDPRGKKSYGGTTKGNAFKKASTSELGQAITEAAQEAPKATDSQRLPRDAKDSVKEYFQNLGGQGPSGK